MSTKPSASPDQPPPRRGPADAVERLYVYWVVTAGFLLFATVVIAAFMLSTRSTLTRQVEEFNEMAERFVALERSVSALQEAYLQLAARQAAGRAATDARQPLTPVKPEPGQPASAGTPAPAAAAIPAETEISTQLDQALSAGTTLPFRVADAEAATRVLSAALREVGRAAWRGETWARLAVLARLSGQDQPADEFARQAFNAGDPLIPYAEISARLLLAAGRAQDAFPHAQHLAEQTGNAPAARLLLARVLLALQEPAAADELLASLDETAALTDQDKLGLARACLDLHKWDCLSAVMATVPSAPPELGAEYNFLQAVALVQQNERLAEALAILEYLAERGADQAEPGAAPPPTALRRPPTPDAYEIATWRGVALLRGRQVESARQALTDAAGLRADRPEAHYWLGMLELGAARYELARTSLQKALATSAGFAPAWEALASLALNSGNLDGALENIRRALEANDRRASAHFLLALAYAKAADREPAAEALRAAFQLEPRYLAEAKQAELLQRLFTEAELEALATATVPDSPPPVENQPSTP